MIVPMLLVRYNLKVQINLRLLPGSQRGTTVIKEGLPLRVASMDFNLCVFMIELLKTVVCRKFGQQAIFLDNVDNVDIYIFLDMI
jgi:hypothetical protein